MKRLMVLLSFLVYCEAFGDDASGCYYLSDTQGCNPEGYPYEFYDCVGGCNDVWDACEDNADHSYFVQGPDWNYTNSYSSGFSAGKTSWYWYDAGPGNPHEKHNVCALMGDCYCEVIMGTSGMPGSLTCKRDPDPENVYRWEDYTVLPITGPGFECTPP